MYDAPWSFADIFEGSWCHSDAFVVFPKADAFVVFPFAFEAAKEGDAFVVIAMCTVLTV